MRFGLLGTGHWAAETHGAGLAAHPAARLVGVWGRDPAKARALAARFGVRAYEDVDALFADVEAVAVALPPDVQAELAVRAATAGLHLLLDKPLATSVGAADRVVAAVERASVASVVFFTYRFFRNVQRFLDDAARGGGWHGARVTRFASIFQPGSPYAGSCWRRTKGGLWDVGPHALSVLLPVLGPVTGVAAMSGPYDTSHVLLRHARGATSTMSLTIDAPPTATVREFVFFGERGVVEAPHGDTTKLGAFNAAISQLVADAAAGRVDGPVGVRFGREVVAILAAAEAALSSARVEAPPPWPAPPPE